MLEEPEPGVVPPLIEYKLTDRTAAGFFDNVIYFTVFYGEYRGKNMRV